MSEASLPLPEPSTEKPSKNLPIETTKPPFICDTSPAIDKIFPSLIKAQGSFKAALKDKSNPHLKSAYADFSALWNAVSAPMAANQLAVLQPVQSQVNLIHVQTIVIHDSGQWIASDILTLPIGKLDAQGFIAASTYARRASLQSFLCISTEDDDDGHKAAESQSQPVKTLESIEL
jgi:hypothetical protein